MTSTTASMRYYYISPVKLLISMTDKMAFSPEFTEAVTPYFPQSTRSGA
jgi:hypothetical protein